MADSRVPRGHTRCFDFPWRLRDDEEEFLKVLEAAEHIGKLPGAELEGLMVVSLRLGAPTLEGSGNLPSHAAFPRVAILDRDFPERPESRLQGRKTGPRLVIVLIPSERNPP